MRAVDRSLLVPAENRNAEGFHPTQAGFSAGGRGGAVFKGPLTVIDLNIRRHVKS